MISVTRRNLHPHRQRLDDTSERLLRVRRGGQDVPALLEAAADCSPDVAREALRALAASRELRAAAELRSRMLHADPVLVADYARTLRELGDREALQVARAGLRDSSPAVRRAAVVALAALGGHEAEAAIESALADRTASVRLAAVRALGAFARPPASPSGSAGKRRGGEPDFVAAASSACRRLLDDPDANVRAAAVAVCRFRPADSREALERAVFDPHPGVRAAVAHRAGQLSEAAVRRLLDDSDVDVRAAAAASATRVEPLIRALSTGFPGRVRQAAATRLGELGDPSAGSVLTAALGDGDSMVRAAVIHSLGQLLAAESIREHLELALHSPDARLRRAILYAAARLSARIDPRVLDALCGDQDADVRVALAQVAKAVCDDPGALLEALSRDADPVVRRAAALQDAGPS